MMELFRKYLILLRKTDNTINLPTKITFSGWLLIAFILSSAIGVILDITIPFNHFLNGLRGVIAVFAAGTGFSFLHIYQSNVLDARIAKDEFYKPFKKRLSYNQRFNLSLIVGGVTTAFVLFSGHPSPTYTLKATLGIIIFLLLLDFAKRDRSEFLKSVYDIPDVRDLRFQSDLQAKKISNEVKKEDKKKGKKKKKKDKEMV